MEVIVERPGLEDALVVVEEDSTWRSLMVQAQGELALSEEVEWEFLADGQMHEASDMPTGLLWGARVEVHPKWKYVARQKLREGGYNPGCSADMSRAIDAADLDVVELVVRAEVLPSDYLVQCAMDAARPSDEGVCLRLVAAGIDIRAADDEGCTALHWAASNDLKQLAAALIEAGADLEAVDDNGDTPLLSAVWCNREEICMMLLEAGADVAHTNDDGSTPLLLAMCNEMQTFGGALLEMGVDINQCDHRGESPLMWAAKRSSLADAMTVLLATGADAAAVSDAGNTALMFAAREGVEAICRELMAAGAPRDAANDDGETAWHWALQQGHDHLEPLLAPGVRGHVDCARA